MNPKSRMVIFAIPLSLGLLLQRAQAEDKIPSDLIPEGKGNPCLSHGEKYSPSEGVCCYKYTFGDNKGKTDCHYLYAQYRVKTDCEGVAQKDRAACKKAVEEKCKKAKAEADAKSCVEKAKTDYAAELKKKPAQSGKNQGKGKVKTGTSQGPVVVQKPAGVSDEVWAMVAGAADKDKARYAKVLQKLKDSKSPEYQRIVDGKEPAQQKALAALVAADKDLKAAKKKNDADSLYAELVSTEGGKKSRLQVALDDTTAAPVNPGTVKPEDQKAKVDGGDGTSRKVGDKETNPVTIITQKLQASPEAASKAVGERLADYIINGSDKGFISKELRDKADVMERIKALPGAWVAQKVKQGEAVDVAQLYFVMGSGSESNSWLSDEKEVIGALQSKNANRTVYFLNDMKVWAKVPADERGVGQCAAADYQAWVHRFLGTKKDDASYALSAVQVSSAILNNDMVKKELGEIAKHIQERIEGPVVSGGSGGKDSPVKGSSKGFDYDALFMRGGVVENFVYQNGDKVSRAISIKMYTVKENGQLVNKVGIFDVTNRADTFGQKFSIPAGNQETTFALDDRTLGMPKYTLKFEVAGGETKISFGREGRADQMKTSVSELYAKRAQQAVDEGNVTKVGDKNYIVLGQGGAKGSLLFFPADVGDRIKSGGDLSPDMAVEVNQRGPDGRNQNIPYTKGRDLGKVGDKAYHLEFNREASYWEVKEGAGDPDTPPPGTSTSTTTAPGGNPGGTTPTPTDATGIEDNLAKEGFKQNAAVRDGLRKDLQDKVRVWSWNKPDARPFATRHAWIFPAELYAPRNLPVPVPSLDTGETEAAPAGDEIRGLEHFIGTSRPSKTLYFDLDQPRTVEVKDGQPQNHPYAQAGYVNGGSFGVPDEVLLKDAIDRAKFSLNGKKIEDVQANFKEALKKRQANEKYFITGTAVSGVLNVTFGDNRLQGPFWPKLDQNFQGAGGHENNPGPGHAFDGLGDPGAIGPDSGKDLPDKDSVKEETGIHPAEDVTKEALAADKSAILYVNGDKTRWYFVYKFFIDDGKEKKTLRSSAGLAFAKDQKGKPAHPDSAVTVNGLKGKGKPQNGEFRYSGNNAKGLWYAVGNKSVTSASQPKDLAANCVGPVIWWGMSDKDAQAACEKDGL